MNYYRKYSIPKEFEVVGHTIKVEFVEDLLQSNNATGETYPSIAKIELQPGCPGNNVSIDVVKQSFYHEKVHFALNAMGEIELSRNEKFVDMLSSILYQMDKTAKY